MKCWSDGNPFPVIQLYFSLNSWIHLNLLQTFNLSLNLKPNWNHRNSSFTSNFLTWYYFFNQLGICEHQYVNIWSVHLLLSRCNPKLSTLTLTGLRISLTNWFRHRWQPLVYRGGYQTQKLSTYLLTVLVHFRIRFWLSRNVQIIHKRLVFNCLCCFYILTINIQSIQPAILESHQTQGIASLQASVNGAAKLMPDSSVIPRNLFFTKRQLSETAIRVRII